MWAIILFLFFEGLVEEISVVGSGLFLACIELQKACSSVV